MYKMVLDSFRSTTREGDADMYAAEAKGYTSEPGAPKKEENSSTDPTLVPPYPRLPPSSAVPGAGGSGIAPKQRGQGRLFLESASAGVGTALGGLTVMGLTRIWYGQASSNQMRAGLTLGGVVANGLEALLMGKSFSRMTEQSVSSVIGSGLGQSFAEWLQSEKDAENKMMGKPAVSSSSKQYAKIAYSAMGAAAAVSATQFFNGELGYAEPPCGGNCD